MNAKQLKKHISKNIQLLFEKGEFQHWAVMAEYLDIPGSSLSNLKFAKTNMGLRIIGQFAKGFPGISLNWLILNEGPMMADGTNSLKINVKLRDKILTKY
ncbi:MAG: hypothetical protein V4538_01530 [Bacteroidota bacterium]